MNDELDMDNETNMLRSIVGFVIGIGFLVCSMISFSHTKDFIQHSIVVPGRVVRLNFGGHHPQVEFVTKDGGQISKSLSAFTSVNVDDQVQVRYRPGVPLQTAELDEFYSIWGNSVVLSWMGLALTVGALMQFFTKKIQGKGKSECYR